MSFVIALNNEARNIKKHEPAESTYSTAIINNEKYFQITTYGSQMRQFKGDASQMIQFNRQSAEELYCILKKEFDFKD